MVGSGAFFRNAYRSLRLTFKIKFNDELSEYFKRAPFIGERVISRVATRVSEDKDLFPIAKRAAKITVVDLERGLARGKSRSGLAFTQAEVHFEGDRKKTIRMIDLK